jgi:phosphatidylglycerol---prolipoprotein diacylglyceryl transferase
MITIGLDPIAFSIGPIDVGWYGIMVTLAVITIVTWALLAARKDPKVTSDTIINAALVGIPSGVIFSRVLHIVDHWRFYLDNPDRIIGGDGLSIWGAVLGAALGLWVFSRFTRRSFSYIADLLAPGIILSQAVGRVGCLILGDDTGTFTSLPWGVVYTNPNSPTNQAVGLQATHAVVGYEIVFNLIAFGVLFLLRKKLKPDGSLFMVYLSLYSVWRLGGDFMRTGTPFAFGLHEAQVISIIVLLICIPLLIWKTRWVKKGEGETKAPEGKPAV